ncbi:hypothetical protein QYF36_004849 [Acer negundo]|nr:hypothetical protein QYF36_004849 [Acer negundo]
MLFYKPSARNMSMAASVGMENKEGLKLLVLGGPHAQNMVGGYITLRLGLRLSSLFALGAGQGFIGCGMEPASEYAQPRVSPYRLAAYLTSAFVIYSGLFWTGLSVVMPEPPAESVTWVRGAAKVKKTCHSCVSFIVGITMDFNMNVNACVPTATQYSSVVRVFILMFKLPPPHFVVRVFHMKNALKFQF